MLFIFSCILLHLASLTIAQTDLMYHDCSNDVGNYTTNSNFQRNLNSVLSSLDSNTQIDYGFYNLSVGQPGPDQANVIALCRGDIGVDECQNCIRNSSGEILQACPNQKEAFGIADACNLRYSNKSIFGVMEDNPVSILVNTANATDVNQFDQVLQTLMSRLRSTAASGNSLRKFATGDETAGFDTIFGLVQCTPDLSEPQGDDCIAGAIREIATCCGGQLVGRQGVRIARPSCNLRYEVYRFFGVTPATPQLPASPSPQAPSVPPPPPAEGKKRNNARTIIIIVVSTVSVVILMISCICLYLRIRKPKEKVESNYTTNSNFQRNLDSVLSSLDSNTQIDYGFYNLSVGQPGPDQANVIALCRGDIGVDECQNCIRNSSDKILQACPNQKEAFGFADTCILRYSNKSIFGVVEDNPEYFMWNTANATDVNQFNQALQTLMSRLRSTAASGNSLRKFATGNETAGFDTIFGLVQCTPDLSEPQCDDCIARAIREIAECCGGQVAGKQGARITRPSCNLRYEVYRFFGVTPSPQAEGKKRNNARTIIIIVVSTVSVVILMISCICLYLRIRKPKEKVETVDEMITAESLQVDFSTIRAATDDFSEENKLGQGGFGSVYKGTLPNGQEVAVKRLSKDSGQGDLEFKNEVLLVAKLQHRNLVRLLGFCLQGIERLLIYEFVLNASLDHFIFNQARRAQLDWERRYKIIGGIARGLLYLHEDSRLRIIHRDLKASNILLDADMNPKISDFGMARLFVMDETQGNTSRIVGTYGYMAPEYAMHGQFSVKSDVFSFGVLVLEIVSGQKNNSFRNGETVEDLLSHAWRNWREGTGLNVIDPALSTGSRTEMMRCIHIGLLCVQENIADRPTMASIVLMLSSHSLTLPVPSQPAFFMNSSTYQSDISSSMDYNSRVAHSSEAKTEALPLSANEASITELYPR